MHIIVVLVGRILRLGLNRSPGPYLPQLNSPGSITLVLSLGALTKGSFLAFPAPEG